jgi:putative transposase
MKKKFTESQIVVKDICRELGISDATFYNWKAKYGGMEINDVVRMRELEKENTELKKMFAEMSIENRALKNLLEKKL